MSRYPRTIENGAGEQLTFLGVRDGRMEVENVVQPGGGPPLHVHHLQDETMTVLHGRLGFERRGGRSGRAGEGETVTFRAGDVHRFWNDGDEPLVCRGHVSPPHNFEYFLSALYDSTRRNGGRRPRLFDVAFLLTRFRSEFAIAEIPEPVQRVLFPLLVAIGRPLGRFRRYADAPPPVAD